MSCAEINVKPVQQRLTVGKAQDPRRTLDTLLVFIFREQKLTPDTDGHKIREPIIASIKPCAQSDISKKQGHFTEISHLLSFI